MREFVDLEIHGPTDQAMGFVEGYRLASGSEAVYYAHRENVRSEGLLDALASTIGRTVHVIAPADLASEIVRAIDACSILQLRADPLQRLDHAELSFEFRCFSPEDARTIRSVVADHLPEGVVLEGFECDEKHTPEAKGAEMYSPVHDYECQGRGWYHGPVPGVLSMSRRLSDQDFIHPRTVELIRHD